MSKAASVRGVGGSSSRRRRAPGLLKGVRNASERANKREKNVNGRSVLCVVLVVIYIRLGSDKCPVEANGNRGKFEREFHKQR